jgi:starch phosphorylase
VALSNWIGREMGITVSPDALFDVQIKRIHEYKRQLLNILETIAHWQRLRSNPAAGWVPRVKVFGGKAAPGYAVAKEIIRLINDVAVVVNADPVTGDLLKIVYPPNYNVTMAERVIPASDLSEQISTAGKEASGTGNMKFMMNGAVTIGTLDGANVEILQEVGAENFFLFGLTAEAVAKRREDPDHAKKAIEASQPLMDVLQMIAEGRFSPDEPGRYHGLVHRVWHHDYFLVAADFAAYHAAQGAGGQGLSDRDRWWKMAALNTARSGFFSSTARSAATWTRSGRHIRALTRFREGSMAGTTLDRGAAEAIAGGWHGDPFGVLGPHKAAKGWEVRAFVPGAERLWLI